MELISEGQKTKPVECYQREGSTFHEVGPVTHKCKFPNTEADASLINHLVKIREEEEQLKDSKKTQKEETVQRKKRGRSFVTVTDQPPRKVQVISSPTKPSVKVIPIKSGPIEDLRIQLIKLLAASSRSERDVFRHCKDYSSSNVLKVLNDVIIFIYFGTLCLFFWIYSDKFILFLSFLIRLECLGIVNGI